MTTTRPLPSRLASLSVVLLAAAAGLAVPAAFLGGRAVSHADQRDGGMGAGDEEPANGGDGEGALVLLAAGESLGNLEPCDCVDGMLGGFPRRLAAIARERRLSPAFLTVDGGDLTGREFHPLLLEAKTRAALELLAEAGVAAVGVGERDLRLGAERLARMARDAGVPLLGANVWHPHERGSPDDGSDAGGAPGRARAFAPHRTLEVDGRRVAIAAVLDPDLGDPTGELVLSDPAAEVRAFVAATGGDAPPLRIVLFHGSGEAADHHLAGITGVDLVVAGHDRERYVDLRRLGAAADGDAPDRGDGGDGSAGEGAVGEAGASPREGGAPPLAETLRDARALTRVAFPREGPATLSHVRLDGLVPDHPWARARVDRYYEEVRDLPEPPRKPVEGGEFIGSQACMDCHYTIYSQFVETGHHQAQLRIRGKDPRRADLPECTVCHVTGFGFQSGFQSIERTPHLAEVGCESCHGVGGNHAARGGGRGFGILPGFPEVWRPVCVGCHDASNSPDFDFLEGMKRIQHWEDRER